MGVIIGVLLNQFFPDIIIVILFVVVLSFNAYKTLKKGIARWKSETKARKDTRATSADVVVADSNEESCIAHTLCSEAKVAAKPDVYAAELHRIYDEDAVQYPALPYVMLVLMT